MTIRQSPFAMVPIEAASDHRLTAMQYRVLIAILSFRNKNSDTAYPRRELIANRCGYSINSISRITAQLVDLGWLQKSGKGGRSSPSTYKITVPETVADPETVSDPATVADPDTKTLADPDTKTVADPARGKEQTSEQKRNREGARVNGAHALPPEWEPAAKIKVQCQKLGLSDDEVDWELGKFRDYWLSASRNARKKDWNAAFRNWCRRAIEFRREREPKPDAEVHWE